MTKPHEETWHGEDGVGGGYVVNARGDAVAIVDNPRHRPILKAAPEMARALLASGVVVGGEWHTERCYEEGSESCLKACAAARAALKSAGVL